MEGAEVQPHTQVRREDARLVALVVGDPNRALLFATHCDAHRELANKREYRTFLCKKDAHEFLVASHGAGSAGAAVCFEELIAAGVRVIVRAGTAGSLQPARINTGDIVVCQAAAREDGVSRLLVPVGMPAVADPHVFNTILSVASASGVAVSSGTALTSDTLYGRGALPSSLPLWAKAGVDVVEMEMAALFVITKLRGVAAGGLCVVDGSPFKWEGSGYDPHAASVSEAVERMMVVALGSVVRLSEELSGVATSG